MQVQPETSTAMHPVQAMQTLQEMLQFEDGEETVETTMGFLSTVPLQLQPTLMFRTVVTTPLYKDVTALLETWVGVLDISCTHQPIPIRRNGPS